MGVRVREKDGSWWVFIHHNGRRKAKKIGDKKTANAVAERIRARLTLGLDGVDEAASPILRDYAADWLRTYTTVHVKPRTVAYYAGMLQRHILSTLGSRRLNELTRRDVEALIADRAAAGLARSTLQGIVATLKVICNHAIDHGVITNNPAARLGQFTRGRTEKEARKIAPYTVDELTRLLEVATRHYSEAADLLTTIAWTGLRIGEALGLQYADLDAHGGFLEVTRTIERRSKGVQITSPKSNRQRRVLIPRALVEQLIRRRDLAAARAAVEGDASPPWIFPNRAGRPQHAGNFEKRSWYPLLERAGLKRQPIHALRHTYASILIQQGESLAFIKHQLGHASIQTTVDIYGHLIPGEGRAGVERLAGATKRNPDATDTELAMAGLHVTT